MSDFNINHITNKHGNYGPVIAGISTVNSTGAMRIPSGNTGMRVEYNTVNDNDIVRDGLVLHIDIANPDCYNYGNGVHQVHDLSGAGHFDVGEIIGTCTYSPDGGGCLELRKSGHINFGLIKADGPFSLSQADQDALTVCSWTGGLDMSKSNNTIAGAWANTATSGWLIALNETAKDGNRPVPAVLVSDGADGSGSWSRPGWNGANIPEYDPRALNYWQTTQSISAGVGNTTAAVGKDVFNHVGQTLVRWNDTRNTAQVAWGTHTWINGLQNGGSALFHDSGYGYQTETGLWAEGGVRSLRIGGGDSYATGGGYLEGKIAAVMIYNRELTGAEITQNYNAQRYRFGR